MKPRAFCAGGDRSIDMVELALGALGPPVRIRKEIVHNLPVVALTAGASALESALQAVVRHLPEEGFARVREVGTIAENAHFPVPQRLRAAPVLTQSASLP